MNPLIKVNILVIFLSNINAIFLSCSQEVLFKFLNFFSVLLKSKNHIYLIITFH